MNILQNNPYRLLGVYSNSPIKERLANHNRMKAFLKVGKPVSFPLDLPQYFSSIDRTESSIADAEAKLTLPKDQIFYAQFWFVKITPLDNVALNHLIAGEIAIAEEIWQKKESASSLQNRIVCALIRDDYASVIALAETLYVNTSYVSKLTSAIVGTDKNIDVSNLIFSFLDILCEEVGTSKLFPVITNSIWKNHIVEKSINPLIDSIQDAINVAKKSRGKGANARLDAGEKLQRDTSDTLLQLKEFLSTTDLQYQMIADKLGLEILQCGIDYYNDSREQPDAANKAMRLQKYAQSIVVGKVAKDRCKENVDILQNIIDNLPPSEIFVEYRTIYEELRKYRLMSGKICNAVTLLNNTRPYLISIKRKLGVANVYYLKLSTLVVGNALNNVIAEVNEAQTVLNVDKSDPNATLTAILGLSRIKSVLEEAWKAMVIMDSFDMETDYKTNRYNKNRSILKGLCGQLGVPPFHSTTSPKEPVRSEPTSANNSSFSDSCSGGCFAFIIIGIIIFIFGLLFK